jgi:hypothetical protein
MKVLTEVAWGEQRSEGVRQGLKTEGNQGEKKTEREREEENRGEELKKQGGDRLQKHREKDRNQKKKRDLSGFLSELQQRKTWKNRGEREKRNRSKIDQKERRHRDKGNQTKIVTGGRAIKTEGVKEKTEA